MKSYYFLLIVLFLFLTGAGTVNAQLADSPWPMFHGDVRHTGLSKYNTSQVDGTIKWTFEAGAGIESSPTIGTDGTIYFGAHDNKFYAINPDGTLKWKFNAGEPVYSKEWNVWKGITSSSAIDKEGTIYFVSMSNYLFALNSDGSEKWRYPVHDFVNAWLAPVIGSDGTIYVGSESYPPGKTAKQEIGGNFYALNPDGTLKWKYESNSAGFGNYAAIGVDGTIYAAGADWEESVNSFVSKVFAFNPSGSVKWKFRPDSGIEGSPTIADDGTIYLGTKNGKFYALNPDGSQKWVFQTGAGISIVPAITKDNIILFGSWNGNFYALNPDGTEKWRFETPEGFEALSSSPAVGSDGTIYFGSTQNGFYALNPDGSEKWHLKSPADIISSPAIGKDGTVYVGAWDKKLYAFGGASADEGESKSEEGPTPETENLTELENQETIGGLNESSEESITSEKSTIEQTTEDSSFMYVVVTILIVVIVGVIILMKKRVSKV